MRDLRRAVAACFLKQIGSRSPFTVNPSSSEIIPWKGIVTLLVSATITR